MEVEAPPTRRAEDEPRPRTPDRRRALLIVLLGVLGLVVVAMGVPSPSPRFVWGTPGLILVGEGEIRTFHVQPSGILESMLSKLGWKERAQNSVSVDCDNHGNCIGWPRLTGREVRLGNGGILLEIEMHE